MYKMTKKMPGTILSAELIMAALPCGILAGESIISFADNKNSDAAMPFTHVYEPETSWAMSATIAWRADETAAETAIGTVRPATCFVWLDKDLGVYDRSGRLISSDFDSYVRNTAAGMIPAFYINDRETEKALKERIQSVGLADCFVVSSPENKELVRDAADLLYVRGMLDFTEKKELTRKDITDMTAAVNGAHGKVIILSEEAASKENVKLLQSLAATVWVRTSDSTESIMRACARGVNGIVTDDYRAAVKCEEFFNDDAPVLLRTPIIIGHRGSPSEYIENTLDSAMGAYAAGADSIENDIQLSKDGEIFILHDGDLGRLFGIEGKTAKNCTLEELRSYPFAWDKVIHGNEVTAPNLRYGKLYGQDEQKEIFIPTLREYLEAFKGKNVIHDTEIKGWNSDLVPAFKKLIDEYDAWDQVFCITFQESVLKQIYDDHPEISIGCLLVPPENVTDSSVPGFHDYQKMEDEISPEAALKSLYSSIDQWNATYNPSHVNFGDKTVFIGRHRGLTVWPWTYRSNAEFARGYLSGLSGLTTDYAWKASELIVNISSENVTAEDEADIPKPFAETQSGGSYTLDGAELVKIEELDQKSSLMIWRYKADLKLGGKSCGDYYLYSEPFVFTKKDILYGDVNRDGNVSGADISLIMKHMTNWDIENWNDRIADVNVDGSVDGRDVSKIQKVLTHWNVVLGQPD